MRIKFKIYNLFVLSCIILLKSNVGLSQSKWILSRSTEGISVYYKIKECDDKSVILLKVKSIRNESSTVEWKGILLAIDKKNYPKELNGLISTSITLEPNSEIIAECTLDEDPLLITPQKAFTRYELSNEFKFINYRAAAIHFISN